MTPGKTLVYTRVFPGVKNNEPPFYRGFSKFEHLKKSDFQEKFFLEQVFKLVLTNLKNQKL
jgi:hypothetical protein